MAIRGIPTEQDLKSATLETIDMGNDLVLVRHRAANGRMIGPEILMVREAMYLPASDLEIALPLLANGADLIIDKTAK